MRKFKLSTFKNVLMMCLRIPKKLLSRVFDLDEGSNRRSSAASASMPPCQVATRWQPVGAGQPVAFGQYSSRSAPYAGKTRVLPRNAKVIMGFQASDGSIFEVHESDDCLLVGRSDSCDWVIHDESVSAVHASILVNSGDDIQVRDMNSSNGSFVDGSCIGKSTVSVHRGSSVAFGQESFKVV